MPRLKLRNVAVIAVIGAVLLPVAAYGDAGRNVARSRTAAHSATVGSETIKIIAIGGGLFDSFWAAVVNGAKDAAQGLKSRGVTFDYLGPPNYNNLGPDLARLEEAALARHPNVVISGNFIPDAQSPGLKAIVRAGITLIEYNTGATTWRSDGALLFIGTDDVLGGEAAGKAMAEAGARHVLCVNSVPGHPGLEARCNGIKRGERAAGGTATTLELPSTATTDPNSTVQAIKGAVTADKKIDGIVGVSTQMTDAAFKAVQLLGVSKKVKLGTFDLSTSNLKRIVNGQQLFAVDQQPYLQGYYAVIMAFHYAKYGLLPPGGWIKTGPLLITKANAKEVLAQSKQGIRGAA